MERQSANIQVRRIAGWAVLTQIVSLELKNMPVRPFHAGGVLFFAPRLLCPVVEDFDRRVRCKPELAGRDVIVERQIVSVPGGVNAVDQAKLDPISISNEKPGDRTKTRHGLKYEPAFILRRLGYRAQVFVPATE